MPKHLRIWQLPTFFGAGKTADVGGWRLCGLPSADVRRVLRVAWTRRIRGRVVADCAARRCGRLRCDLQTRRVVGVGELAGASYGGQSAAGSVADVGGRQTAYGRVGRQACGRSDVRRGLVRLRRTRQMRLSVLQTGLSAGLSARRRALRQGGGGGLRENCHTLVSYAFWRAKFFYKRRACHVKEMLRIWVFLKEKYPPQSNAPPPADARKRAQEAA